MLFLCFSSVLLSSYILILFPHPTDLHLTLTYQPHIDRPPNYRPDYIHSTASPARACIHTSTIRPAKMTATPLRVTADTSKRRRFQPPITTFFSTSDSCSFPSTSSGGNGAPARVSHHHYSAVTSSPTPVVPGQVQSSLLSVGMRVRKSIADGYKTKGTFLEKSTTTDGSDEERGVVTDEGDAFSLPSSSQESVASSTVAASGGQKRAFDFLDDDDDDDDDYMADEGFGGSETGVRTILAPSLGQQRRRFIAMKHQNQTKIGGAGAGGMDVDDFEEASFLRKRNEVDV